MTARIPVTILSGYLGAGKTTIINRVLAGPQGHGLAVLVNDFGAINIDAALVRQRGRDVVELNNGCVCCTIGDDLGETLTAIAARPERPARVLIEASGVAEPARIAMSAGHWPGYKLNAVLVAADAETIRRRASDKFVGQLVRNQLDSADIVLLTKTDRIKPDATDATETWLHGRRKGTWVERTAGGRVATDVLFSNISGPIGDKMSPSTGSGFVTRTWQPRGPVDITALKAVLDARPDNVHRAKGFVTDAATGHSVLVQCDGARTSLTAQQGEDGIVVIAVGEPATLDTFCTRLDRTCVRSTL
ncbi:MAG: CobW family GTP-binding protein [Pseudooceanicola atlanticus]